MQFKELKVIPEILKALEEENYSQATPIQEEAIPIILDGKDMLGCAQTGTGKTAAFAIPTLQLLSKEQDGRSQTRDIAALILTPTRELAIQIYESTRAYGKYTGLQSCVVYGGVSQKPQERVLRRGVDILVATPGRLLDLMNQRLIDLRQIKILILDEADRMLDMGFIHDVKKIVARTPKDKQTLLFSATMPEDIAKLSRDLLNDPERVDITPVSSTVESTEQYMYHVDKNNKKHLLAHLLQGDAVESALVFSRTKHGANGIVRYLIKKGVSAEAIHGDKSQVARQRALKDFKNRDLRVLVATDIAARGIDIDELSHVINYDLPEVSETYVHRIGRTGRAGLSGTAISFCSFDEKDLLKKIERLIDKDLAEIKDHPFPLVNNFSTKKPARQTRNSSRSKHSSRHKSRRRTQSWQTQTRR